MPTIDRRLTAGANALGATSVAPVLWDEPPHNVSRFVNADLIAAGLSPFDPAAAAIRAGRIMLQEIDGHAAAGRSFAFETRLAGRGYLRRMESWRSSDTSLN